MNEIIERRLRHLKRLQADHNKDFWSRFGDQKLDDDKVVRLSDTLAANWNRQGESRDPGHVAAGTPEGQRPLPKGWRNEHWKTQQAMAFDYAGVRASTKAEAMKVLQTYEDGPDLPPAA